MEVSCFKNKYLGFGSKLYRVAYRFVEDEADAQDLVQETYTKLWSKRADLNDVENSEAYAMTILRNLCLDFLRTKNARNFSESVEDNEYRILDSEISSHDRMEFREDLSRVESVLEELPQQQADVLRLRHWDDLSIEEIEKLTGLTAVNVRVLLSRGRKRLKELFQVKV